MTIRQSPSHEEEGPTGDPPPSLDSLFTEIDKMSSTLQRVATDVTTIKEMTTEMKATVTAIQESLVEVEMRIKCLEETSEQLPTDGDKRKKLMEVMWDHIQALENQSKRNNVRLIGLKETFGTNGTFMGCVQKTLIEGLGLRADAEFKIEGAHRHLCRPNDRSRYGS